MILSSGQYDSIKVHALGSAPAECCGLLFCNRADLGTRRVATVVHTRNDAEDKTQRFSINQRQLAEALIDAENMGEVYLGSYHSHPQGPPTPSKIDVKQSGPGVAMLIVGMGTGLEMKCWRIQHDGTLVQEDLRVESPLTMSGEDLLIHNILRGPKVG